MNPRFDFRRAEGRRDLLIDKTKNRKGEQEPIGYISPAQSGGHPLGLVHRIGRGCGHTFLRRASEGPRTASATIQSARPQPSLYATVCSYVLKWLLLARCDLHHSGVESR